LVKYAENIGKKIIEDALRRILEKEYNSEFLNTFLRDII